MKRGVYLPGEQRRSRGKGFCSCRFHRSSLAAPHSLEPHSPGAVNTNRWCQWQSASRGHRSQSGGVRQEEWSVSDCCLLNETCSESSVKRLTLCGNEAKMKQITVSVTKVKIKLCKAEEGRSHCVAFTVSRSCDSYTKLTLRNLTFSHRSPL